jgi:HK97 family phage major capsid protein
MRLDQLTRQIEARRQATERREGFAAAEARQIVDTAQCQRRSHLTPSEAARVEQLLAEQDAARAELRVATCDIDELRSVIDDEADYARRSRESHPTGVALPGAGDYAQPVGGAGRGDRDSGAQWVRESDGRPAVVGRSQRFADHPVIAEQIERSAGRDEHVIGMHGGIGHLVRSMSTTSGSAVVPTVWAADVIDRARNLAAVMQAGAEIVPMDSKIVQIGRLTADPAAGFRAEGSAITATDPTFDNVTLTATTLSSLVVGSLEWFQDVTPGGGADQLVTEALAKVLALQIDLAALSGGVTVGVEQGAVGNNLLPTGGLANPRGILATLLAVAASSVLGAATNGTVQTAATFYKEVLDTIYTPRDFNEAPNAMIWPSKLAWIYAEAVNTLNDPIARAGRCRPDRQVHVKPDPVRHDPRHRHADGRSVRRRLPPIADRAKAGPEYPDAYRAACGIGAGRHSGDVAR